MNNPIGSCIFIKKSQTEFEIIVTYVDDLNLVGTSTKVIETTKYLKKEFEMIGKTKFVSICGSRIFQLVSIHQSTYIKKTLKRFNMDKAYPLNSQWLSNHLI